MKLGKITFNEEGAVKISGKLKENIKKYVINSGLLSEENLKNQEIICSLNNGSVSLKSSISKECELNFGNAFRGIENMKVMHPVKIKLLTVEEGDMFTVFIGSSKYLCIRLKKYGYYNITKSEKLFCTFNRELPEDSEYRYKVSKKLNYILLKKNYEVQKYNIPEV